MAVRKRKPSTPEILEIDGIPTAAGLARQGLAQRRVDHNGRAYILISDEGHKLIGQKMRALVAHDRANGIKHTVDGKR